MSAPADDRLRHGLAALAKDRTAAPPCVYCGRPTPWVRVGVAVWGARCGCPMFAASPAVLALLTPANVVPIRPGVLPDAEIPPARGTR